MINRMGETDVRLFNNLIRTMNVFRDNIDPEFYMQYAVVFMVICMKPDLSIGELAQACDMQPPTMSRVVTALSTRAARGRPGYGLIDAVSDPEDYRRKIIRLTPDGVVLRNKLLEHLHKINAVLPPVA